MVIIFLYNFTPTGLLNMPDDCRDEIIIIKQLNKVFVPDKCRWTLFLYIHYPLKSI